MGNNDHKLFRAYAITKEAIFSSVVVLLNTWFFFSFSINTSYSTLPPTVIVCYSDLPYSSLSCYCSSFSSFNFFVSDTITFLCCLILFTFILLLHNRYIAIAKVKFYTWQNGFTRIGDSVFTVWRKVLKIFHYVKFQ